jgi:hypothetical protein
MPGLDLIVLATTSHQRFGLSVDDEVLMTKAEQRRELWGAVLTHLETAANLLKEAEEEVLADETRDLTDKVDVVALSGDA